MVWRAFICAMILASVVDGLSAQGPAKSDNLTTASLQKRLKAVQDNTDVPASTKEKIVSYLQEAISRLEISQENSEAADKLERKLKLAAGALKANAGRLAELPATPDHALESIHDINELDRMVAALEKELDDGQNGIRKQILELEAEAAHARTRPEELINELAEVEERLRQIEDEIDGLATSGEPRDVMQARQYFLISRRHRAESERRLLQAETAWTRSPIATELLQVQQELAAKSLTLKVAELQLLEAELGKRRGDEADQRVHRAEFTLEQTAAGLKPVAEENLAFAREQRDVAAKLHDVEQRHAATSTTLAQVENEFEKTKQMVADVGLTDTIGLLLRQQRAKLLDPRTLRSSAFRRNDVVRETRMRLFQLESDRATLIDLDAITAKRATEMDLMKDRHSIPAGLRNLLAEQRQVIGGLEGEYRKYFAQQIEMDVIERRLLDVTTKYRNYVDERVLWIRTGQAFGRDHITKLAASLSWISHVGLWTSVGEALVHNMQRQPAPWLIGVIALICWLGSLPLALQMIRLRGDIAAKPDCRDLFPTLQTIGFTLMLAAGLPGIMTFLAWRLDQSVSSIPFVHAVAAGLYRAAMFAFPLELLRFSCLRGGLAERHFGWPQPFADRWRRNLHWFIPVGVGLIGIVGLMEGLSDEHRLDTLGRGTFLVFAALSALFSYVAFHKPASAPKSAEASAIHDADAWSDRFWRFAPTMAIAACIGLLAVGWSGYFYTALQLTWRLQQTAWLVIGLLMVRAVIRRWIALERRRMAILQDQELRSIAEASREPGNASQNPFLFPRWNWPDFRLNLTQIVTQMRQLLDTGMLTLTALGLWFVWADVTPALNILDGVTLWQTTIVETVSSPDGDNSVKSIMRPKRVTAENLGFGILILAIATIAGRNVPGLVEVILLEHLSVDAGIRFAVTWLVRYAIFTAGVCCASAQIGIGWSNVQWLVAAGSVGLGFGLQEIFCNFVSGIILLFERPMRVGDVVTIGDTTGTVSRIRFRATTIVDGDRKELIVPNKEFITGHLLNWTLSDRVNRVCVKVVVASGNDPIRVRKLLLEIAGQQPNLLREPAPSATLDDVNGGLTFSLRGFLPSLDSRGTSIHELYTSIDARFKAEGIDLSCPTQEIFVRMRNHEAHASQPAAPHQIPTGVPIKPLPMDFSTAFRRA